MVHIPILTHNFLNRLNLLLCQSIKHIHADPASPQQLIHGYMKKVRHFDENIRAGIRQITLVVADCGAVHVQQ